MCDVSITNNNSSRSTSGWWTIFSLKVDDRDYNEAITCLGITDVFLTVLMCLLVLATLIGNILVVLSVVFYRRMRTFTNYLLVSLASSDFMVGVLIMPLAIVDQLNNHRWMLGGLLCKMWVSADVFLCTASILNLCAISLDRYFAITNPLKYARMRSGRLACGLIACVWTLSAVICSPPLLITQWRFNLDRFACGYNKALSYRLYSAFGSFYIPLLVMLFVYYKIFKVANSREQALNLAGNSAESPVSSMAVSSRRHTGGDVIRRHRYQVATVKDVKGRHSTQCINGGILLSTRRDSDKARRMFDDTKSLTITMTDNSQQTSTRTNKASSLTDYQIDATSTQSCYSFNDENSSVTGEWQVRSSYSLQNQHKLPHHAYSKHLRFELGETFSSCDQTNDNDFIRNRLVSDVTADGRDRDDNDMMVTASKFTKRLPRTPLRQTTVDNLFGRKSSHASLRVGTILRRVLDEKQGNKFAALLGSLHYARGSTPESMSRQGARTREKLIYLKERKALKTIGIVVCGFVFCWLPFFVNYLVEVLCPMKSESSQQTPLSSLRLDQSLTINIDDEEKPKILTFNSQVSRCELSNAWQDVILWLGYSNSVLNPIVYTFYNRDFRRCFKDLLICGCLKLAPNRRMSVRRLHQSRY